MADPIIPINPNSDLSQIISMMNQNFAQLGASSVKKIYNDTSGIPSIIEGILPDGTSGIVVSKSGKDVTTLFS